MEHRSTRRTFLLNSTALISLLPLTYSIRLFWGDYPHRSGLKYLTSKEVSIFLALFETILPRTSEMDLKINDVDLIKRFEEFIESSSSIEKKEISLLLWASEHLLPVYKLKFSKFSRLSVRERYEVLESLNESAGQTGRLLVRALKTFVSIPYYNDPQVQTYLGHRNWCDYGVS